MNPPRLHYAWLVLTVGTLVVFGSLGLARFGYTVVLPSMQSSLGLDNAQAGALATANLIGYLALSVAGGALASRYGPRRVITAGLALAGLGMVITGFVRDFSVAALARLLTGIGSGASNVPVMGLMAAWFASKRRGLASGIAVSGSSIALIVLGPLVPRLLNVYGAEGWRVSWLLFGGVTLALAVIGYILLRDRPGEKGLRAVGEEAGGARVEAGTLQSPVPKDQPPATAGKRPTTNLQWSLVYRSPAVWQLGPVYLAFGFAYITYMTFFTKCLIAEHGFTKEQAGNLFMLMGWFSLGCGLIWGTVSDWIGRKYALAAVYAIQATAIALFEVWPGTTGLTLSAVLFGLTAWSTPAIMAAACGDLLGPRLAPAGLGLITLFFGFGQAVGPSVAGLLADASGSFLSAYLLASGVLAAGAVGALFLRPSRAPDSAQPQAAPGPA